MPEENVKVAVRVRPFNRRERERNAELIIGMQGQTTEIKDPSGDDEPRKFTFDYSYWSHDGSKEDSSGYYGPDTSHPNGKKFADQKKVYSELGVEVLKNAWEGYNSTLFAYGQTGSGKSWSVVGYGVNKGIVPMFCDDVFKQINEKKTGGDTTEFEVTFSMLEIYNEQVRDLLSSKAAKRGGLKVRQHPKKGFYAEGLIITPVVDYADIEKKMEEGTMNRTVASTNMNATSSRAHTIVGITFIQKFKNAAGEDTTKSAVTNLVDLAGSERAESTGATGDRLKEGAAINQSLSCLGNCIAALADRSSGKNTRVPYRDSVLTKLLKNALGGNSKTIMIAALSPADINFDETLSTLRYADRAKQIKNSTSVNEDPTEKLIRELQEENEKLKAALASGNITMLQGDDDDDELTDEEKAQIKAELEDQYKSVLEQNQQEMEEMKKTFEQKLKEAAEKGGAGTDFHAIAEKKKTTPHLSNLNPDSQLSGHIIHFLDAPQKTIGSAGDIVLKGPSIVAQHAVVKEEGGKFSIEPCDGSNRVMCNGKVVVSKTELHHSDRLIFGSSQYYVFINIKEKESSKQQYPEVTYDMAQEEMAKKSGFNVGGNKTRDTALLESDVLEVMPAVSEANGISQELDKKVRYDVVIVPPDAIGDLKGRAQIMVKETNIETKAEWMLTRTTFMNRQCIMEEMYENYQEGEEWQLPQEKDPFYDDPNSFVHIGSVKVYLKALSYNMDSQYQIGVIGYDRDEVGMINMEMVPCDKSGKALGEDAYIEDPGVLMDKEMYLNIKLTNGRGLPSKFTDYYATYCFNNDDKEYSTKKVPNTNNPDWNFVQMHSFPKVTKELLSYFEDGFFFVRIYGKNKPPKQKKTLNTKDALMKSAMTKGQSQNLNMNEKRVDAEKVKFMMEAAMLRKRTAHLEMKLAIMKRMLEEANKHKKKKLSTKLINDIYHAPTADAAEKCIKMIPQEKDDDSSSSSSSSDEEKKKKKKLKPTGAVEKKGNKGTSSSSSDSDDEKKKAKKQEKKLLTVKTRNANSGRSSAGPGQTKLLIRPSNPKSSSCILL